MNWTGFIDRFSWRRRRLARIEETLDKILDALSGESESLLTVILRGTNVPPDPSEDSTYRRLVLDTLAELRHQILAALPEDLDSSMAEAIDSQFAVAQESLRVGA